MHVEEFASIGKIDPTKLRKLSDYEPLLSSVLGLLARDTRFKSRPGLDAILAENKRLVVVFSHAAPMSWIPAPCLLTAHLCARGGGSRRPLSVVDRFFYSIPGLRELAKYITQSDRPLSFKELVHHFETLGDADFVVFPEGSNCFFGDPNELQPFRSTRFVEIAIRTKTPMLLCVHRGSESWGKTVPLDHDAVAKLPLPEVAQKFLGERLKNSGVLTIPFLPQPMSMFSMLCELYRPEVQDLPEDGVEAKKIIEVEAARVHEKMKAMLKEVDETLDDTAL